MDNNQKGALTILGTLAAVFLVAKHQEKKSSGFPKFMGSFAKHHQGYADRQNESLGMRRGAESHFTQSMKDRRDESYGAWGHRGSEHPGQHINR